MDGLKVLEELTEYFQPWELPWLDRDNVSVHNTTELGRMANEWKNNGLVILPKFMDEGLMQDYEACWQTYNGGSGGGPLTWVSPGGWRYATPYMDHRPVLDMFSQGSLHDMMSWLIGEPMGLHLNLTGWVSTTRDWHQDGYLNPDHVRDWYTAVWVALEDITEDSGPFQYVPGSHKMIPPIRQDRMLAHLEPHERGSDWPTHSERILTSIFEDLIEMSELPVVTYLPKRGDVLIWHARLLHRGSRPTNPLATRRAAIAHYSGINHRPDMPVADKREHRGGLVDGYYFPIQNGVAW